MYREIQNYVHFHGAEKKGKILMVASSPAVSLQTGWPIGFWASELTHPLRVFLEAGYDVEIASTEGGEIKMDSFSNPSDESGYSSDDIISLGFMQKEWFKNKIENTPKIDNIDPLAFDAIFVSGGQGPMYTYRGNKGLQNLFATFFESGKPSAVVCHGTTLLLEARGKKGDLIVKGRKWTGFTNAEEDFADQAAGVKIQPYRIEEEAAKIPDTDFKTAAPFSAYAIADGNLITGQQQNSGEAAARLVVEALTARNQ